MLNWQNQGHHLVKYSNQTGQYAKKVLFSTATNCGTKLNRIATLLSWRSVKCTNSTESPFCKSAVSKLNLKISAKHWKEKATEFFFLLSHRRLWLRPSNRQIAVVEMQRSRGHWSQERMPCLTKHIVAWKSEEMLVEILIHRVYFEKSAWLSRSIHKVLDNVQGLGKMAMMDCGVAADQIGPGILVSLKPCLSWKMQSISRAQRRFLEEKGNTGKQIAKVSFSFEIFQERKWLCEFNFVSSTKRLKLCYFFSCHILCNLLGAVCSIKKVLVYLTPIFFSHSAIVCATQKLLEKCTAVHTLRKH